MKLHIELEARFKKILAHGGEGERVQKWEQEIDQIVDQLYGLRMRRLG